MSNLMYEKVWIDKPKYDEAERLYYERKSKAPLTPLADEVAKARKRLIEIKQGTFDQPCGIETQNVSLPNAEAMVFLKAQQKNFENLFKNIQTQLDKLSSRIDSLESHIQKQPQAPSSASKPTPQKPVADDEDDGVDLFASDSEEEEESEAAAKLREERLAAYNAKKSKKPTLIAKSSILLDVKPWDDETDMKAMETEVRKIEMPGLLWGAAKLVPLAYGIHKLQINCVIEDELVSVDSLQEQIEANEDYVQSVDIAAFNKI